MLIVLGDKSDRFYDALASGVLSADGKKLSFTIPESLNDTISEEIYIRDEWVTLYQRIMENKDAGFKYAIITGIPGIGKSEFMTYCMWKVAVTGQPFLLQSDPAIVLIISPGTSSVLDKYFSDVKYPFFVDMAAPNPPHANAVGRASWVGVFSSPDPRRYKELLKKEKTIKYIMNPWSKLELYDLRDTLSKFNATNDMFDQLYDVYGGVPRHILNSKVIINTMKR